MPLSIAELKSLFLVLPEVREGTSYDTLAFFVAKRFLGRLRDDDTVLALRINIDERDLLIEMEPEVFFTTDHYRGYPYILIRLAATTGERIAPLLERAWREAAPKRVVARADAARST